MRNLIVFIFCASVLWAKAQVRIIDVEPFIVYPDSGHYYISFGEDSMVYYLINHGPDTLYANDKYWNRWLLANVYPDPPLMKKVGRTVYPSDSLLLRHTFPLVYYNHRPKIQFCIELKVWDGSGRSILKEEDSSELWENNKVCTEVAHNRITTHVEELTTNETRIYPNPISSSATIMDVAKNEIIRWFDVNGREIFPSYEQLPQSRIYDVLELDAGVYFISTSNGSFYKVIKR